MKKRLLALILATLILTLSLVSCDFFLGDVDEEGDITVVIENADGSYDVYKTYLEEVENKDEGAKGVVEHLQAREENSLHLEMVNSTYGAYVSGIGSIKESATDKMYVIVYTSVAADSYDGAPTIDYEGTTLYQSGLGISGMAVPAGGVILFRLEKSPY